jgi:hypothetical protein
LSAIFHNIDRKLILRLADKNAANFQNKRPSDVENIFDFSDSLIRERAMGAISWQDGHIRPLKELTDQKRLI